MSYILDALKKAEAERDPQARVSLAMDARERQRQRLIQYLVITALLVNAAVLGYLFAPELLEPRTDPAPTSTSAEPTMPDDSAGAPVQAELPRTLPTRSAPVGEAPAGRTDNRVTTPTPSVVPATVVPRSVPASAPPPKRVALSELPPAARSRFPGLSFSTHLFSSDPDLRAVVVNGQRLKEGDQLGVLTLASITEDGVVFRFEDYLVSVSVLDDWN
jgi:general secretion pathway protein B